MEDTKYELLEPIKSMISEYVTDNISTLRCREFDPYDGSPSSDIYDFLRDFEQLADCCNWSKVERVRQLPIYLTGSAKDWYHLFIKGKDLSWAAVVENIKQFFLPPSFGAYMREELRNRIQKPDESVVNYAIAKLTMCVKLNPAMSDLEKIEHLYVGLNKELLMVLYPFNPQTVADFLEKGKRIEVSQGTYQYMAKNKKTNHETSQNYRRVIKKPC